MIKKGGFTLLELLIGMTCFAILICLSISFSASIYQKNKLEVATGELKHIIHYAKTQAQARQTSLILAPLAKSDWSMGAILFVDNSKHTYDSNSELLHQWSWNSPAIKITWNGFQSNQYLIFSPDLRHSAINGFFQLKTNSQQQKLIVNRVGRVRSVVD